MLQRDFSPLVFRFQPPPPELLRSEGASAHAPGDRDTVDLDPFLGEVGLPVDDAWVEHARRLDNDVPVGHGQEHLDCASRSSSVRTKASVVPAEVSNPDSCQA